MNRRNFIIKALAGLVAAPIVSKAIASQPEKPKPSDLTFIRVQGAKDLADYHASLAQKTIIGIALHDARPGQLLAVSMSPNGQAQTHKAFTHVKRGQLIFSA